MKLKFVSAIFRSIVSILGVTSCLQGSNQTPFQLSNGIFLNQVQFKTVYQTSNKEDALKFMNERLRIVRGIFNPEVDPYVGVKVLPPKCRPENLPVPIETEDQNQLIKTLSLYSSRNRIFGNCVEADQHLKTQYLLLYCKKTGLLFSITYFYKDDQPWLNRPVANCNH